MPPKKQTTAEQILEKAFEMVRQDGYDSLTARKLAGELNCSTQPIYQAYADMNGLKLALIKKSQEVIMDFISKKQRCYLTCYSGKHHRICRVCQYRKTAFSAYFHIRRR